MEISVGPGATALPKDVWSIIIKGLRIYNTIFVRASSKWLYAMCKEFQPFPRYHVLDQDQCMTYLIELGSISCLEYVKQVLHFEWREEHCSSAARTGQLAVLEYLRENGPFNKQTVLIACTKGTCDINIIKYLHETGVPWEQEDRTSGRRHVFGGSGSLYDRNKTAQIVTENMAFHGHLECLKYAVENGVQDKRTWYTPSIECLDFVIANGFDWKGGYGSRALGMMGAIRAVKLSFCEEAAIRGDLAMLKYAHQKGAPLQQSASIAASEGHLDCLRYVYESEPDLPHRMPTIIKNIECFKYLLDKFGKDKIESKLGTSVWAAAARNSVEYMQVPHDHQIALPERDFHRDMLLEQTLWSVDTLKFAVDTLSLSFTNDNPYSCARHCNLEVLKFIKQRNLKASQPNNRLDNIISEAIYSRKIEVLKFIWDEFPDKEGVDLTRCWLDAAQHSTPEIMEFLTEKGVQWTSEHLSAASKSGNLSTMAYLTRIECQWEDFLCYNISPMCVKYARKHGCQVVEV